MPRKLSFAAYWSCSAALPQPESYACLIAAQFRPRDAISMRDHGDEQVPFANRK